MLLLCFLNWWEIETEADDQSEDETGRESSELRGHVSKLLHMAGYLKEESDKTRP